MRAVRTARQAAETSQIGKEGGEFFLAILAVGKSVDVSWTRSRSSAHGVVR